MSRVMLMLAMLLAVVAGSFLLGNSAHAVDPDELRERTRPQVQTREKADQPDTRGKIVDKDGNTVRLTGPEAPSEAFKKYATMRMLAWRVSPGGSLMIMGQFNSADHCAAARKKLNGQIVRLGWGRSECIEYLLP